MDRNKIGYRLMRWSRQNTPQMQGRSQYSCKTKQSFPRNNKSKASISASAIKLLCTFCTHTDTHTHPLTHPNTHTYPSYTIYTEISRYFELYITINCLLRKYYINIPAFIVIVQLHIGYIDSLVIRILSIIQTVLLTQALSVTCSLDILVLFLIFPIEKSASHINIFQIDDKFNLLHVIAILVLIKLSYVITINPQLHLD